nr:polyprotein [Moroccan watermelon mosaic virus]
MAAVMFGSIAVNVGSTLGSEHLRVYGGSSTQNYRVESSAQPTKSIAIGDSCAIARGNTIGTPVPKVLMAKSEFVTRQERASLARRRCLQLNSELPAIRIKLAQEKEREAKIFEQLEKRLNLTEGRKNKYLLKDKKGRVYWKVPTKRQLKKIQKSKRKVKTFQAPDNIISNIDVSFENAKEFHNNEVGIKTATSTSTKRPVSYKVLRGGTVINQLIREVSKICKTGDKTLELHVGKKERIIKFKQRQAFVHLRHMEGLIKQRDCDTSPDLEILFEKVCTTAVKKLAVNSPKIIPGSSGLVVFKGHHLKKYSSSPGNYFIVRGRHEDKLYDARVRIGYVARHKMVHYSNVSERFWDGFNTAYIKNRKVMDHTCTSDLDVRTCGEVAALVTLILFPSHRITCKTCSSKIQDRTIHEVGEQLHTELTRLQGTLNEFGGSFGHVSNFLFQLDKTLNARNENFEDFSKINEMIGVRKEAPFIHLMQVNEVLIKGSMASAREFAEATQNLLEVVRWHMKRTESIQAGSVASFRNKASGKAHLNLALMCDNQLDKNGNFLWGERQYHAKRYFANFYEKVDNSKGYEQYVTRSNPNGSRKLAIRNLIISTNFDKLREQMRGEMVHERPVSKDCISLRRGNYVHVCSCVTLDDGKPVESELTTPTRNHLVIGNTGDSKYLDLPTPESESLYIAKNGYCYMNIFLAMLVNIPEGEAKSFTKLVRDVVADKLGMWPTMRDVATAAYYLTVFHPDAANAELPRILVDHNAKVMHVIDSFGSLSTGYHILKANTVSQLIQFARDPLEGEMKNYMVGGKSDEAPIMPDIFKIIKCVYKQNEMCKLLFDEPYVAVVALHSPAVLIAMFNSGSLEVAIKYWIKRDQEVSEMFAMIETLAQKVSVARSIGDQFREISLNSRAIRQQLEAKIKPWATYDKALELLNVFENTMLTNESLETLGYRTIEPKLKIAVEKIYTLSLQQAWEELNLREKLRARLFSFGFLKSTTQYLVPAELCASTAVLNLSPKLFINDVKDVVSRPIGYVRNIIVETCSSIGASIRNSTLRAVNYCFSDLIRLVNVLLVITLLMQVVRHTNGILIEHKQLQQQDLERKTEKEFKELENLYMHLAFELKEEPTSGEFIKFVEEKKPKLVEPAKILVGHHVIHQAKTVNEKKMEQILAFVTLIMMFIDAEKSDCVYRILNKFKGVVGTIEQDVYHQSLDDIQDLYEDKQQTIDFDLDINESREGSLMDVTFSTWWDAQLARNNTVGHYRIGGEFIEFTRNNASTVAATISHSEHREFLIRGAVGSGKSTNLPHLLAQKGNVLLIEPTRPLCENVCKQLRGEPFHKNPTIRMRGLTSFGSTPITVMTSGFALHFYAHNVEQLHEFDFILFDECHVIDAQAMGFYCLMKEHDIKGKVLKVSATPPGRETEFSTQHPVKLVTEESISFQQLVSNFGTGANSDVTKCANNILVYVASYNEVDQLSKLLLDKGYLVTKVDGRTMKVGRTEIETKGTSSKKHFIVATNIIENGVTLDIDAVVDFGMKVVPDLDADSRLIRYSKQPISYGERIQRLGRVGRHKAGIALRIGHTEKGIAEIPELVATEAAFLSFAYGLPVMTHNVGISLLSKCTVRQARTMMHFELNPLFTVNLVAPDGTMHPKIMELLKGFKLRDSEIRLCSTSIPHGVESIWLTAKEYESLGCRLTIDGNTRIPFIIKDIPELLYENIWKAVELYRRNIVFGRINSALSGKIAYTLQTDIHALPRTIATIETLIESENAKHAHFKAITSKSCTSTNFSLLSVINSIQSRYMVDHSLDNIKKLQQAKSQLQQFQCRENDVNLKEMIQSFGAMRAVYHQEANGRAHVVRELGLKGIWNKSLLCHDALVSAFVFCGGAFMVWQHYKDKFLSKHVYHQGFSARQRQKLKFRDARIAKIGREVYGDDGTIEHFFGEAYTKKGKGKGKMHGMGVKTRKFVSTYGFKPEDYSYVRYLDPLTGETIDENVNTDVSLVQEHFGVLREKYLDRDLIEKQKMYSDPGIKAYYVRNAAKTAIEVDLTPHNPLKLCNKHIAIAGFPEREHDLRQTGLAREIPVNKVPSKNEDAVIHEGKSLYQGMKNYNGISSVVCHLTNTSGSGSSLYGLGYNSYILTNRHLFRQNNGSLIVQSSHGKFVVKNTTTLKVAPVGKTDIVIIRMPKDFPPFHSRLRFREPHKADRVCLVGADFQEKYIASKVSEASQIVDDFGGTFGRHWISTNDGDCGLPLVSVTDGFIIGLHSLSSTANIANYFAMIPENFEDVYIKKLDALSWDSHWKYNPNEISWGSLTIHESKPEAPFRIVKEIHGLQVYEQNQSHWLYEQLHGNLKAVCQTTGNLVTKHVVKGPCMLFQQYLNTHEEANAFFRPLMGRYMKSKLNREAYAKDLLKYAGDIIVGEVDCEIFENSLDQVIQLLNDNDCPECEYVTCSETIINSLNMDAAVGALYSGKKRKYFEGTSYDEREQLVRSSCQRLFEGKLGVWNGSLKAEIRPAEKVLANKTRTFTAAPLDTLLGAKVCVDDFNNWFYSKNIECPWTVGMTKFYKGWDEFLRKFPDGWIYCDADGSQFDSSLSPYLINAVLQIRLWAMEEWDIGTEMLKNLYTEITYTPIATPDGTIIKKFKGNNSGQPSTVVDNTLMVLLAMHYALNKAGYDTIELQDNCVFYINGDDLCIAVHPEHEAMLDTFQKSFNELGLNYDFSSRHKNKEDLWFMSHKGVLIDGLYIPKLEQERIVAILEWDKAKLPEHRLEAISAAIIESWGYPELTNHIRKFYQWVLEQAPYSDLALKGKAPYVSETGLRNLYTSQRGSPQELEKYITHYFKSESGDCPELMVYHQADNPRDAGQGVGDKKEKKEKEKEKEKEQDKQSSDDTGGSSSQDQGKKDKDKDVDVGTTGTFRVPKVKTFNDKMILPRVRGRVALNLEHLLQYNPNQIDLSNTRATQNQFDRWYDGVKSDYGLDDEEMAIVLNGFMVWCIENGTSPNVNGVWTMMDNGEQVEYLLKPMVEHASPTLRQIMAHYSNAAEAYIAKRNATERYMPRYGQKRNLRDISLARYAFDFYEMTSKTPERAREAHMQMKAAAIRGANTRLFGIDGNVGGGEENTERHTVEDVDRDMHSLLGMRK